MIEEDKKPQKSDSDDDFKVVKLSTTYARSPKKTNNANQREKLPTQDIKNDQNKYNKKAETNSAVIAVKTRSARTSRNTKTVPKIEVSTENKEITASEFFTGENTATNVNKTKLSRKRTTTTNSATNETVKTELTEKRSKPRAKSSPSRSANTSKYFKDDTSSGKVKNVKDESDLEDGQRVSHKDLLKQKTKAKNDVTSDLVDIIKNRVKEAKAESKKNKVKGR